MNEILYIPKLKLALNMSKIAFSVGPIKIYWYGILITIGFILGFTYVSIMAKRFKLNVKNIIDPIVYSVFGGIIGARAYYVIFNFNYYRENLWEIFKIWHGGIAIYGGIVGAFIVGIIVCKYQKIPILPLCDLVVGGLILGQAIGRWGNFVNMEAFGCNTDFILGMTSQSIQKYLFMVQPELAKHGINIDPISCVHPCFFYESMWCLMGFLIIVFISTNCIYDNCDGHDENKTLKRIFHIYPGELALIYCIWYGIGRFFIENLRVDSLMLFEIKVSRMLSLILVIVSFLLFLFLHFINTKKSEKIIVSVHMNSAEEILKNFSDERE